LPNIFAYFKKNHAYTLATVFSGANVRGSARQKLQGQRGGNSPMAPYASQKGTYYYFEGFRSQPYDTLYHDLKILLPVASKG
jgi:hypothetical protein